jgi:antitoxin PrlF
METSARVTSKGQITVPKSVREALNLEKGDEILFRVEGSRAILSKTPDFLDLAGVVKVPAAKRNVAWADVIQRTHADRSDRRS